MDWTGPLSPFLIGEDTNTGSDSSEGRCGSYCASMDHDARCRKRIVPLQGSYAYIYKPISSCDLLSSTPFKTMAGARAILYRPETEGKIRKDPIDIRSYIRTNQDDPAFLEILNTTGYKSRESVTWF